MRFSRLVAPAAAVFLPARALGAPEEVTMEELQARTMEALRKREAARPSSERTLETAAVRKDWFVLPPLFLDRRGALGEKNDASWSARVANGDLGA